MKNVVILAIESSCDDTSAAVIRDGILLSNVTASQGVHEEFGGVVPELASRAHQLNIVPVVDAALKRAGVEAKQLSAIAFTRGPGLLGSLLVGTSFAKGLALSLGIPLIDVNHLQAHILAHFIKTNNQYPISNIQSFITDGTEKNIKIPYGIQVNPYNGDIYITDAKNYVSSGQLHCYSREGKRKWSVRTGDIPAHMCFVYR